MARGCDEGNVPGRAEVGEHRDALVGGPVKGRGAGLNPGNRFETTRLHVVGEFLDGEVAGHDEDAVSPTVPHSPGGSAGASPSQVAPSRAAGTAVGVGPVPLATSAAMRPPRQIRTIVYRDDSRSVINRVTSPDVGFDWSLNPYRGCEHGCIYCYARPYHEFLGFSCGLDFETRIMAKLDAAELLRRELAAPSWKAEPIGMAAATDCYQPVEAKLRITRACLEVLAACRQPVHVTTKSRLVLRDLDLLTELARHQAVHVAISLTTLDAHVATRLEPRASSPAQRLRAIEVLSRAGVPTLVLNAPVIPGLTDRETPRVLKAAAEAGAGWAGYELLRLPGQVQTLFLEWLSRCFPQRAAHIENLIRQTRDGALDESSFFIRFRGRGPLAEQLERMFRVFRRRYRLEGKLPALSSDDFRPPADGRQGMLF